MPRKKGSRELSGWALGINNLMTALRLSQEAFAAAVGVTPATVSYWLNGKKNPSAKYFFRMAQLSKTPEIAAPFLKAATEQAGFDQAGITPMFGGQRKSIQSVRLRGFGYVGGDAVGIPLLKDAAAAGQPRQIDEREVQETLPMPRSLCPHPDSIVCVRVEGDSMSPFLEAGYIVAVDTSQFDYRKLVKQMVAARDPEGGVTIKWLRKSGKEFMLVPQRTSPRHEPVLLTRDGDMVSEWAIVGQVIWWIGMPPK